MVGIILLLVMLGLVGFGGWYLYKKIKEDSSSSDGSSPSSSGSGSPSPSPRPPPSVTINDQTFDPKGYMVSKGYFWNTQVIPGTVPSVVQTDEACRNRCIQTSPCVHFSRQQDNGMCYLNQPWNTGDPEHVRGFRKGSNGTKEYGDPATVTLLRDTAGSSPIPNAQVCADMCTREWASSPSCIGWTYRQSNHPTVNLRNTCVLAKDDTSDSNKYVEGIVNRT